MVVGRASLSRRRGFTGKYTARDAAGGRDCGGGLDCAGEIAGEIAHRSRECAAAGGRIAEIRGLRIDPGKVRTNIVIFDCRGSGRPQWNCASCYTAGILAQDTATYSVRMLTHVDVNREGIERRWCIGGSGC